MAAFAVRIVTEEAEDDVEHLLVMPLGVSPFAVGYGGEERLEELQHAVHVVARHCPSHANHHGIGGQAVGGDVIRDEASHQSDPDLLIGNVEGVSVEVCVIVFDGDVSALVKERDDTCHPFGGRVEIGCHGFGAPDFGRGHVELVEHFDEVGGRAAPEPVRT